MFCSSDDSKHVDAEQVHIACIYWAGHLAGRRARVKGHCCLVLVFCCAAFVVSQVNTLVMNVQVLFDTGVMSGV